MIFPATLSRDFWPMPCADGWKAMTKSWWIDLMQDIAADGYRMQTLITRDRDQLSVHASPNPGTR